MNTSKGKEMMFRNNLEKLGVPLRTYALGGGRTKAYRCLQGGGGSKIM